MRKTLASILVLALAGSAFGAFFESEPNDTIGTADDLTYIPCNLNADVGLGSLVPGDGDHYAVFLPNGCILTAITTPLTSLPGNFGTPDTLLAVLNPVGALIIESDDAGTDGVGAGAVGPVRGSAIRYMNTGPDAVYYLRVRGFLDNQTGDYALTLSLIPEPATMGLLLGGLALLARKRR